MRMKSQQHETALAMRLRLLWEEAHGVPAGEVHALIGSDSVAVWLDDVLSLAERAVIERADDRRLMERYAEQLLVVISPNCRRMSKLWRGATWLPAASVPMWTRGTWCASFSWAAVSACPSLGLRA